nr:reverse transcriptase domain-containing protein [Tanacetum cinerariifolium]
MSTRSSARNLFSPLDNPKLTIRRRSHSDQTLLNNSEIAAEGNGDLPLPDLWTMEELCQPSLNGRGGHIALIAIQATNFGLKNDIIQQVQNSCQFHGLPGDVANKNLDKFLHVTQSIKVNGVTDDALRLYLFPHSLIHHATAWFDRGTFMQRHPEECYDLIENMTTHHNDWVTLAQRSESSSFITSSSDTKTAALTAEMAEINKNLIRPPLATLKTYMLQEPIKGANQGQNQPPAYQAPAYQAPVYQAPVHQPHIPQPQVVTTNEFTNFMKENDAILKNMQTNMTSLTNSNLELKNMFGQFMKMNTASSSGSGTLPGNTITNPKEDLKSIITQRGTAYPGPTIPITTSSSPVVERETEATKNTVHPTNNGSTKDVQPPVVPTESPILNSEPVISPIIEPVASPFGSSIKSLLTNKDKLCELARTPLNEHHSAVLLKKFLEKPRDLRKFLILCDFLRMVECLALADLGASINLMPLSVWNKLSLPDLSPMCMTLELADHSISHSVGVAEDVYVKVGTFHFPADFVVVDFDADPRVPLILERSFLKTERALIDVFEGELTLRVGKEAITFNLDQTSRYSTYYNDMTANRIDIIDMACEEYSQEVLGFSDVITSGNPTPYYDLILSTTSLTLTPFGNSDFLLEEVDAFLALKDDSTSLEVDQSYLDTKGDILLLEAFLNDDPSLPPPNQGNYLPEVRKELKICEAKYEKSSIDKPPEVELKDLPPHLEYAFLEENFKPAVQHQRRVNPKIHDVIKQEVLKLLDAGLIYPISGPFSSTFHGSNAREISGKSVLLFSRQFLWLFPNSHRSERLGETTFTCPYGTFAYRRMPFGLCNAPGTFQRCMMAIFHDMIEKTMKVFMDDFSLFRNSFQTCLSHLKKMLKGCEDTNLCLNWEKSHFMVKEGIVLGYKISKEGIEVGKAKVDVITKLPHPIIIKVCKGHAEVRCRSLFSYPVSPQTSGQVEVSNHGLKRILERTIGENHASWSDKLDDALWAFRTAYKTPIGCTLYKLVYEKACHLPIELEHKAYLALKHANFDLQTVSDYGKVQLNELRDQAYKNPLIYKEKTKRLHDLKIKDRVFNIGDRVLLFNS